MNWIERMYDFKGKDLYSQNGEGFYLEYIFEHVKTEFKKEFMDLGGSDGFYLSNTKHLKNLGWIGSVVDKENDSGYFATVENIHDLVWTSHMCLLSIDIDGNDYWILQEFFKYYKPQVVIAEFNPAFTDSRTIKYNHDHVWDGTDYYGFSFEAGKKLAESNGYKVIFQVANMNMIMVREDLINVSIPEVKYEQVEFFDKSNREDWIFV